MESLTDETWDVVIAGTSLSQSLLALSLSKCNLKVLHVDKNEYYGGVDAGLSLEEAENWIKSQSDTHDSSNSDVLRSATKDRLGSSRAYTISLKPQIVYAKSRFLPTLVSSRINTQLEFQAVGSFWVLRDGKLQKIPSNREDVFADDTLSVRDKRRLMGLLRYVLEEQDANTTDGSPSTTLLAKLQDQFKIPDNLRAPVQALSLTTSSLANTDFDLAIARLKRHLASTGYFGPGLAAVMAKYGSNSELAQVACRAGAVGGFTYLLGHGIAAVDLPKDLDSLLAVELTDGTKVRTKRVVGMKHDLPVQLMSNMNTSPSASTSDKVAHQISIVSQPLRQLFTAAVENGTVPAIAVVLVDEDDPSLAPIYLQIHSSETGECPAGQCIIHASTCWGGSSTQARLRTATNNLVSASEETEQVETLWSIAFILEEAAISVPHNTSLTGDTSKRVIVLPNRRHDIAFDDTILDNVKIAWDTILGDRSAECDFLRFEETRDGNEDE